MFYVDIFTDANTGYADIMFADAAVFATVAATLFVAVAWLCMYESSFYRSINENKIII